MCDNLEEIVLRCFPKTLKYQELTVKLRSSSTRIKQTKNINAVKFGISLLRNDFGASDYTRTSECLRSIIPL
jgi:hypothetical protein